MGLLLLIIGLLLWLLVAPTVGIILMVIGAIILLAGFLGGPRVY